MEPGASTVEERLRTLEELSKNGINTWVFLGPVMPYITDVEALVDAIAEVKPKYVLVDKLRMKDGVWDKIIKFIEEFYPEYKEKYPEIFFGKEDFYGRLFENIKNKCDKNGLKCEINKLNV